MQLRNEAEQLAKIYIPVLVVSIILKMVSANVMGSFFEGVSGSTTPSGLVFTLLKWVPLIAASVVPFAIGTWLFFRARTHGYNPYLWAAFGMAANLFAAAIYFLVRVCEQPTFNKAIKNDAAFYGDVSQKWGLY